MEDVVEGIGIVDFWDDSVDGGVGNSYRFGVGDDVDNDVRVRKPYGGSGTEGGDDIIRWVVFDVEEGLYDGG